LPILPIIDLLILMGWTALMVGAALKAIDITTAYRPTIGGLTSLDFAVMAAVCFGFALTLAARTWVKLNEPALVDLRRRRLQEAGRQRARELELEALASHEQGGEAGEAEVADAARVDRR
jgi:hypothetical protein